MRVLQPPELAPAKGYANGIACEGTFVFVSGQIGWDAERRMVSGDFVAQVHQALRNIMAVLGEAGAAAAHIARMTWYITDKREYLAKQREIGVAYRDVMGRHFPAMSVVEVSGLIEEGAKVEIEATAVIPR
ncbi:MAG TPA: RidA family protein [Candidatus Eremiobacteraceae bacterium]|nr:RidA family protein [Candidatus Eremiobacteraceae bacterium]